MNTARQRGAVAPLIAVMLFVIVISISLVVDLGHIHNAKGQLQSTVDAAALAGARYVPTAAEVTAVATATARENIVDGTTFADLLDNEPGRTTLDVAIGNWDQDAIGSAPVDRWTLNGTPPNAVKVRATRDVNHVFFFFLQSTTVVADAIAVAEPINPILPLTVTSCIPLDSMQDSPGLLPGKLECDIGYYRFNNSNEDSAAWTGLTFGHDVNDISKFLKDAAERRLFEQVLFGLDQGHNGIENSPVVRSNDYTTDPTPPACAPVDLGISCGLGPIPGYAESLAPPGAFAASVPAAAGTPGVDIPVDATGGFWTPDSNFDPMYDFPSLPRWYHVNDDDGLQYDDYFTRVWTLDGLLQVGPDEKGITYADYSTFTNAFGNYQKRLRSYYDQPMNSAVVPAPFADNRMKAIVKKATNANFNNALVSLLYDQIGIGNGATARNEFLTRFGLDSLYWPDSNTLMKLAGYPLVGVNNGSATRLMGDFLSNDQIIADPALNILRCSDNDPLNGRTLKVQIPVIFTGYCQTYDAISNPSANFDSVYIGLADLLITRLWKNPGDFDCGSSYVHLDAGSGSCLASSFSPALAGSTFGAVNSNTLAVEGLFKEPQVDPSAAASIVRVFLVE